MIENDNSLSFEERMKNQKIKRKKALIIKLCAIISVFLLLALYFVIPFSHASNAKISGTKYYTKEQILQIANVKDYDSLYIISADTIEKNLNSSPLLGEKCSVSISPFGLKINVNEKYPCTYLKGETNKYFFNDGTLISNDLLNSDDPLVGQFLKDNLASTIQITFDPSTSVITSASYQSIIEIINSLTEEQKSLISYIGYSGTSANDMMIYIFDSEINGYLKLYVNLNNTSTLGGVKNLFNEYLLNSLKQKVLNNQKQKSVEGQSDVYSWKANITESKDNYEISFVDVKEN